MVFRHHGSSPPWWCVRRTHRAYVDAMDSRSVTRDTAGDIEPLSLQ